MRGFLLDTNCISEAVRFHPRALSTGEGWLYLSVLTLGEIREGLALPPCRRRTRLETWLEAELRVRFSERVLSIDSEVLTGGTGLRPVPTDKENPYLLSMV